jgi:hypothetical protein
VKVYVPPVFAQPLPRAGKACDAMPDSGSLAVGVTVKPPVTPGRNHVTVPSNDALAKPEYASVGVVGEVVSIRTTSVAGASRLPRLSSARNVSVVVPGPTMSTGPA